MAGQAHRRDQGCTGATLIASVAIAAATMACAKRHRQAELVADDGGAAIAPAPAEPLGYLALGAGGAPADYQVSIAQDLALARKVLPGPGRVLFGSGPGSSVTETRDGGTLDPSSALRRELGDLFAPRSRSERFVPAPLKIDGPASWPELSAGLAGELRSSTSRRLWVYIAGHGEIGTLAIWPQGAAAIADVAGVLDQPSATRPLLWITTTCFGGSFDVLAFRGGDPKLGPTDRDRCGLFATTADLPATGCDPNPNRRAQEGYGIHFLNALRGRDRDGAMLDKAELDYDGDGRISALEAHTRARVASKSGNVPTTTSERYLRQVAPAKGDGRDVYLPEEQHATAVLAKRLGISTADLHKARDQVAARMAVLEARATRLRKELDAATAEELEASRSVIGALLARWPVLDDPWHPDYESVVAKDGEAIGAFLAQLPARSAHRAAVDRVVRADAALWSLRIDSAPVENLLRSLDTQLLAGRLAARAGAEWDRYQRFRKCERAVLR